MISENFINGVLRERWNDTTRTYTAWNASGVQTSTRPYTTAENTAADAAAATALLSANQGTIRQNLIADQVAMQAIIDDTNANIRSDPSQEIKSLSRAVRRLTRLTLNDYSGTD